MYIQTEVLGEISYELEEVIHFDEGIYGFEEYKNFILVSIKDIELPFQWMQSTTDSELSFILTTPFAFHNTYDFEVPDHIIEQLEIEGVEELSVYSLVVLNDSLGESTLNLKAPIIINSTKKKAIQLILNEDYPYKYKFLNSQEAL